MNGILSVSLQLLISITATNYRKGSNNKLVKHIAPIITKLFRSKTNLW